MPAAWECALGVAFLARAAQPVGAFGQVHGCGHIFLQMDAAPAHALIDDGGVERS